MSHFNQAQSFSANPPRGYVPSVEATNQPPTNLHSSSAPIDSKAYSSLRQMRLSTEFFTPPLHSTRIAAGWTGETRKEAIPTRSDGDRPIRKLSEQLPATQQNNYTPRGELTEEIKYCDSILEKLIVNEFVRPFREPVGAYRLSLHDYHMIIKHRMNIGMVELKMDNQQQGSPEASTVVMRFIYSYCYKYNPAEHGVVSVAQDPDILFEWWYVEMPVFIPSRRMGSSPFEKEEEKPLTQSMPARKALDESGSPFTGFHMLPSLPGPWQPAVAGPPRRGADSDSSCTSESSSGGSSFSDSEHGEEEQQRRLQELHEGLRLVTPQVGVPAVEPRKETIGSERGTWRKNTDGSAAYAGEQKGSRRRNYQSG